MESKSKQEYASISDRYKEAKFHEMEKGGLGSFGVSKKEKKLSVCDDDELLFAVAQGEQK